MAFGISFALISIQESNVNIARHGSKGKPKQSSLIFLENQRPRQSAGALPNPGALKPTPPLIPVSPRPVNRRDDLFCVDVFIHRVNEQRSTYKPPTRVHENIFNDRVLLRCLLAIFFFYRSYFAKHWLVVARDTSMSLQPKTALPVSAFSAVASRFQLNLRSQAQKL